VKEYLPLLILGSLAAVAFVLSWRNGYFLKITAYVQETKEELKKCTWPDSNELKESTTVVMVAIGLLGAFTMVADFVISYLIRLIT